jgi:heptosyltransferase-1
MRVLFVKTSSLGDVVHQCPAVSDAARAFPDAQIDWVVEEAFAGIARMHTSVRRALPVALRRWRKALWQRSAWGEMRAFRAMLAAERYDAVIDTQGLLKSALVTAFSPGRRHGMDAASARESVAARFYDVRHAVPRALHAVERNRRLTSQALGFAVEGPPVYGLRAHPLRSQPPYSVFLTMTSRADKLWPESRWIELGRALAMPLVLPWGSEPERARASRIAAAAGNATVADPLSLEQLAELFAGSRGVVGLDTGLTHLAAALGVRTIGVYCGSDPALTGLYGSEQASNLGGVGMPPSVAEVLKRLQ